MKRTATADLLTWADDPARKPLVLRGARQVGKTWLVESFARERFGQVATLDLERHPRARELFREPSPRAILAGIEGLLGQRIEPGRCLLFLDEVQSAPEVLPRLRYFHEELPQLHVVAAGSLLDFALAHHATSLPVGRMSYLFLEPLSFPEFVAAVEGDVVLDVLKQHEPGASIPRPLHDKLLGLCREYALTGGMPAVVERYRTSRSLQDIARVQHELLGTYRDDFARYGDSAPAARLLKVLDGAAHQVGRRFVYREVDRVDRAVALRAALECLCRARVCHRVHSTHGNGLPLQAEAHEKEFKVLFLDSGLLLAALGMGWQQGLRAADLMLVNEGALAEQLVGQMLRTLAPRYTDPVLHYWSRQAKGAAAEVDYLLVSGTTIVPVEVKAGKAGRLRSLHQFVREKNARLAVRVSSEPPHLGTVKSALAGSEQTFQLLSIPFYLVGELPRLLGQVQAQEPGRP